MVQQLYAFLNMNKQSVKIQQKPAYIALLSVLILGAIGTAITTTLLLTGIGNAKSSFVFEQSTQAWALANGCAEEGLQKIRDQASFTGTGNLTLGQGTCTFTVTDQGGESRTVFAQGTVGTITRKSRIIITAINPSITISNWSEVAN